MSTNTGPVTESERAYALDLLRETKQRLHQLVTGLSSEQVLYKTNPDRWSISDCVEHMALVEIGLAQALQTGIADAAHPDRRTEIRVSDVDVGSKPYGADPYRSLRPALRYQPGVLAASTGLYRLSSSSATPLFGFCKRNRATCVRTILSTGSWARWTCIKQPYSWQGT